MACPPACWPGPHRTSWRSPWRTAAPRAMTSPPRCACCAMRPSTSARSSKLRARPRCHGARTCNHTAASRLHRARRPHRAHPGISRRRLSAASRRSPSRSSGATRRGAILNETDVAPRRRRAGPFTILIASAASFRPERRCGRRSISPAGCRDRPRASPHWSAKPATGGTTSGRAALSICTAKTARPISCSRTTTISST